MRSVDANELGRRSFLKGAAFSFVGLSALPVWSGGMHGCASQSSGAVALAPEALDDARGLSPTITLVSKDEQGEPLIVSGTIYGADGAKPLQGVTLYVYHTDAKGLYSTEDGNGQPPKPRLKGRMLTDASGRYEFRTIKPASYPNGGMPAHIHASATKQGQSERWIDMFLFEGDPHLSSEDRARFSGRGRFSNVMAIKRDAGGLLRCERDIKLD